VHPLRTGRLRQHGHLQRLERVADDQGGLDDFLERGAVTGVEVEMQVVGRIDVVARGVPLVQVDAPEVHHPQQRCLVLDHREVDDVAVAVIDPARLDPRRPRRRCALHEEEGPAGAVRIALHHHRAVTDVRQQDVGDVGVVLEQIALGQAEIGPKNLPQIGDADFPFREEERRVVFVARDRDLHVGPGR
jgi:hypothetical protein